jgi:hypothetical protein
MTRVSQNGSGRLAPVPARRRLYTAINYRRRGPWPGPQRAASQHYEHGETHYLHCVDPSCTRADVGCIFPGLCRWAGWLTVRVRDGTRPPGASRPRQFAHANCRPVCPPIVCRPVRPAPVGHHGLAFHPRGWFTRPPARTGSGPPRTHLSLTSVSYSGGRAISLTPMSHWVRKSPDQVRQMMASAQSSLPLCMTRTRSAAPARNPEATSRSASPSSRSVP